MYLADDFLVETPPSQRRPSPRPGLSLSAASQAKLRQVEAEMLAERDLAMGIVNG